jgi:hypothetical protein
MNSEGQVTKQDANYTDKSSDPARHCCGLCESITKDHATGQHFCKLVEGEVKDLGGCELFSLNLIRWANWKIPITS